MPIIRTFDSTDDLFDFLEASNKHNQEAMKDHPIKVEDLRHGDFVVSLRPDQGVVIFGEVVETTKYEEDNEGIQESRTRGWIFGRYYSEVCTEGEFGDTHVTRINAKISKEVFDRAKANGFRHLRPSN